MRKLCLLFRLYNDQLIEGNCVTPCVRWQLSAENPSRKLRKIGWGVFIREPIKYLDKINIHYPWVSKTMGRLE